MAQFNLGVILDKLGKPDESIEHYEQALRIDPGYVEARFNLANSLRRTGGCPAALGHYDRLRQAAPGNSSVRVGEALCLIETGQHDRARVRLDEGLGALPDDPLMVSISARLFAASPQDDLRDGERAVGLAQGLVGRQRGAGGLETLAMALAEVGRFEEAIEKQLEAIALSEKAGSAELRKRLHGNLERYRRGEPCRDPAVR